MGDGATGEVRTFFASRTVLCPLIEVLSLLNLLSTLGFLKDAIHSPFPLLGVRLQCRMSHWPGKEELQKGSAQHVTFKSLTSNLEVT